MKAAERPDGKFVVQTNDDMLSAIGKAGGNRIGPYRHRATS